MNNQMLYDVLNFIREIGGEPNAVEMIKQFIIRLQMEGIVYSNEK